jgi:Fungal N-terminal domain of STAND proteins
LITDYHFLAIEMDPLSITASIFAALQAANSVVSLGIALRNNFQNHAAEVITLTREIRELRNVLEELADVAELADGEPDKIANTDKRARLHSLSLLRGPGAALDMCQKDLTTVERRLNKEFSKGKVSGAVARTFGWSKFDEDIKSILARLDRYKNTFQLALVQDEA